MLLFLLSLLLSLSATQAQAQDETLADWFYDQWTWDETALDELNHRTNEEYSELTGAGERYTQESLIERNEFYLLWPDFANRERQLLANSDLRCLMASSHDAVDKQIFYAQQLDPYFVSSIMHENQHTDIWQLLPVEAPFLNPGTMAWGFQLLENGNWDTVKLNYLEEAFVATLSKKMMIAAGFTHFREYGSYYETGAEMLDPVLTAAMFNNHVDFGQLWDMHSRSDILSFFDLLGRQVLIDQGREYTPEEAVRLGYEFGVQIDNVIRAQVAQDRDELLNAAVGATCGMLLRFSPEQMDEFNQEYNLDSQTREDVWFSMDYQYFLESDYQYIIEEDYYDIINR